jgi:acyl-CoA thioester hydrolase
MTATTAAAREGIIELRVRYAETDQMGVVYHANYLIWCEIGRTDLIRQLGTSYADLEKDGVALAVIDASVRYHFAAKYDDMIRVRTVLTDVRSRTVTFNYTIENATTGARLASASTTLASFNKEGKLVVLPGEIRKAMEDARS